MILDGVVDPTGWVSFEVMFDAPVMGTPPDLSAALQLLYSSLADTEKTYSGLTDGCAKAGRAGCKLIEFIGDNASGDDVKALLDYAHDVWYFVSTLGRLPDRIFITGGPGALSQRCSSSR